MADQKLAEILRENPHSDPWLHDFLKALRPGDTAGLVALQQAMKANREQHGDEAQKHSNLAATIFHKNHNMPGELRARYQEVYAYQRLLDGKPCLNRAATLEPALRATNYHELMARFLLDKSICEKRAGRPSEIETNLDESQRIAEKYKFQVVNLRVLGIASGLKKEAGLCDSAWTKSSKGLEVYWTGAFPLEGLYQLYQPLSDCAEKQQLWHIADALRTHAIHIRESMSAGSGDDTLMLGMLYLDSASILIALKREEAAEAAFNKAEVLLNKDKDLLLTIKSRAVIMIRLAELQLENGNPDAALKTLATFLPVASTIGDTGMTMWGYRVLGDIERTKGSLAPSADAYKAGIILAEQALSTLSTSRERLDWISTVSKMYRGLTEIWLKQGRGDDGLKLWEWYKSRSIQISNGQPSKIVPNLTWHELERNILQISIPKDPEPRVVYAVFDDGVQAWIIRDGIVNSKWQATRRAAVEQVTNSLFEKASTPTTKLSDVWKAGEQAYPLLWQAFSGDMPQSGTVIIELDAPIQHLLPEAIRAGNRYLFDHYQFVYSPGVLMDKGLRPTHGIDGASPAFLLNASTSSGESPIPSQVREVRTLSRQFRNLNIRDGATVTLPEINFDLERNEIFIFAGHGLRSKEDISLIVNRTLLLKARDLSPANMERLQLAVLAACSTGTTDENGLMDTRSLDNSFLAAGVPRVISSRWDVEADSTADLMEGMVTKLGQRTPVAVAMYSVQQDILKKEQHPYYWAGFYLAGRAN